MPLDIDEIDHLVGELAASLGNQHSAFVAAAYAALGGCSGVGQAYRILAPLQRRFFDPPVDPRVANMGARHYRAGTSKLANLPAIGEETVQMRAQAHRRGFRLVG